MKREDLKIGNAYTTYSAARTTVATLEGFDKDGDPVLKPVEDNIKMAYYTEVDKSIDPVCNVGCFGHSMNLFLALYKEVE